MASGPPVRKRRIQNGCANPLFVKWVQELRDEAAEKGTKSQYTYSKALSSLRRYPLPLSSGQEAKILDHVGEKLAKTLDKRLELYKATREDNTSSASSSHQTKSKDKMVPPSPQKRSNLKRKSSPIVGPSPDDDVLPKSKRQKSAPREYIPGYRTGPYALIIALYQAEQKPSWCGYLKKAELIAEAKTFSDSSFTVCESGSYYNAWSSMSTMVERGLIIKYSQPPKFKLSEEGVSMAVRLLKGGHHISSPSNPNPPLTQETTNFAKRTKAKKTKTKRKASPLCDSETDPTSSYQTNEIEGNHSLKTDTSSSNPYPFSSQPDPFYSQPDRSSSQPDSSFSQPRNHLHFWYANSEGQLVHSKDQAAIMFNDELSVGFLIKCKRKDLQASVFPHTIDSVREPQGEYVFAYLTDKQCPGHSNPPPSTSDDQGASNSNPPLTHGDNFSVSDTPPSRMASNSGSSMSKISSAPVLITLSDSESDCVDVSCSGGIDLNCSNSSDDMQPLADRIGLTKACNVHSNPLKSSSDQFNPQSFNSISRPNVESENVYAKSSAPFNHTPDRSLTRGKGEVLTPSQRAGMAALKRHESELPKTIEDRRSPSIPLVEGREMMRGNNGTQSAHHTERKRLGGSKEGEIVSARSSLPLDPTGKCQSSVTSRCSGTISVTKELNSKTCPNTVVVDLTESDAVIIKNCGMERSKVNAPSSSSEESKTRGENEVDLSCPEFVLRPGSHEVILCVDSAESTASRKQSSQFRGLLLQELGKNGVQFDVRKLNVGDFLWVAREKVTPIPGQLPLPQTREVVLEYVVERKRMDDLAGSITDGRFKEQKFRLKNSGVRYPIYLVEEFRDMSHLQLPQRTLHQAITNTQIKDGFYIKRTKDIRESIAYLTLMTRQLQRYYANKTLKVYPCETVTSLLKTAGRHRDRGRSSVENVVHSMPFSKFNEASVKNKVLTVYEMFGRHLMQLPGVSADKAFAVLEAYPTAKHLRQAYLECANASQRARLLSNIKAGKSKRRLGECLSELVYSLYWLGKDMS